MVIAGAESFEETGILKRMEEIAAFDDAVDAALEIRVGERFQQGARECHIDACDIS